MNEEKKKKEKGMDPPGIEPGTPSMRMMYHTTRPQAHSIVNGSESVSD